MSTAPYRLRDLPEKYLEATQAVTVVLVGEGEDPKEFRTEVREDGKLWIFQLWHIGALVEMRKAKAKDSAALGNPGGKCRTIVYDLKNGTASKSCFWQ